jgi:ABC-type uncharacterized transport system substrate-binding protein
MSFDQIKRREFITLLGGAAAAPIAWPFSAFGKQAGKLPTIGYMALPVSNPRTAAFVERMRELGWIEDRTVAIEYRWAEGRAERVAEIAAEFVRRQVDIIVTYGEAVTTLKQATTSIPIVMAVATDPVGIGLVASLARPGGNVTGLSVQQTEITGKRIELLRAVVPGLRRLAILFDAGYPASVVEAGNVEAAARMLGLEILAQEIRQAEDIVPAFNALKDRADALYVVENVLLYGSSMHMIRLALDARLPTTFTFGDLAKAGALMSYGPNLSVMFRRAADYVDKILKGARAGDLPVEQPTKFDFVINLKTAKALGLEVPSSLLAIADAVIE